MFSDDTTVTKTEAIAALVLENMALKNAAKDTARENEERTAALIKQIQELEELKKCSFHCSFFEKQIKKSFEKGEIPIPEIILKQQLPTSFNFSFGQDNGQVSVTITFKSGRETVSSRFVFVPVLNLDEGETDFNYPDFQSARYTKPPVVVKKVRKPVTKKLVPTPLPNVQM